MNPLVGRSKLLTCLAFLAALGCFLPSEPERPTQADISIEGSSGGDFQLILSTAFYEARDQDTMEIRPVLLVADTSTVRLPHTDRVALTRDGMVLVRVTNLSEALADIRLRVTLNTGVRHDESATVDHGDSHTYYFLFNPNGGRR